MKEELWGGNSVFDRPMRGCKCDKCLRARAEAKPAEPEPTFDPTKPVRTVDGHEALIGTLTPEGTYAGAYLASKNSGTKWCACLWKSNGECINDDSRLRLVNAPERVEGWVNIYDRRNPCTSHQTGNTSTDRGVAVGETIRDRWEADAAAAEVESSSDAKRIACIKVSFEKGEGL